MREQRRLILARRQLMLAQIVRREAMATLAAAIEEESRSAALAHRSRDLLREYGSRIAAPSGKSLRDHAAFVRTLHGIAQQADRAYRDASDQAEWQVRSLAAAETRASRFEERMLTAQSALEAARTRREDAAVAGMARKLQRNQQGAEQN